MQKLHLEQITQQKLSPQQIQAISLLQLSHADMQDRIDKELEENPALDQEKEEASDTSDNGEPSKTYEENLTSQSDSMRYKSKTLSSENLQKKITSAQTSWQEELLHQLALLPLDKKDYLIGKQIIGSLDADGYMRKNLNIIVDDIAFNYAIDTNLHHVEQILYKIQNFDPIGIGARNLQECLLLQLQKQPNSAKKRLAKQVLTYHFELFAKRNYEKIMQLIHINDRKLFKDTLSLITQLNPKLIDTEPKETSFRRYPDFIVNSQQGKLQVMIYREQIPTLKVNKEYTDLLVNQDHAQDPEKQQALHFIKQRIMHAKWFIEAIKKRKKTLLRTMKALVELQKEFFEQGEETSLKPIFLRDVAEKINMDISTVSRVVNQKSVQTDWGIYPLKYFFSEPIYTTSGKKVSSRIIKNLLTSLIKNEDKLHPYSDIVLTNQIKKKGYLVARRTVSKYRDQLKIPVARLRKSV